MTSTTLTGAPDDEPTRALRLVTATDLDRLSPAADPDRDAETTVVGPVIEGVPVDADDRATEGAEVPLTTSWADITSGKTGGNRPPVIPLWLRSPQQRRAVLRAIADLAGYTVAFHTMRTPKYAAKTAWYAPIGLGRTVGRVLHWATAEEGNWQLRQHAASTNDAFTWQALNRTRSKEARGR
jgi:S-DNA-T family DNA segregation ATPase FtsK/SpoIIIE